MCEEVTGQRIFGFGCSVSEESKQSLGLQIKEVTKFVCLSAQVEVPYLEIQLSVFHLQRQGGPSHMRDSCPAFTETERRVRASFLCWSFLK